MKGTEMYELSGRAEGVDWSDVAMAGRAYADNIVGEPAVTAAMHSMADEIERLRAEVAVLKDSAEKLYDIAASGAEPPHRRRMLDQMAMESFAENG